MRRIQTLVILIVVVCLVWVLGIQAMSSANYRLDWMVPLTGAGGESSSTSYIASTTMGQTAVGEAASTNYSAELGYWYGVMGRWSIYLPIIQR